MGWGFDSIVDGITGAVTDVIEAPIDVVTGVAGHAIGAAGSIAGSALKAGASTVGGVGSLAAKVLTTAGSTVGSAYRSLRPATAPATGVPIDPLTGLPITPPAPSNVPFIVGGIALVAVLAFALTSGRGAAAASAAA